MSFHPTTRRQKVDGVMEVVIFYNTEVEWRVGLIMGGRFDHDSFPKITPLMGATRKVTTIVENGGTSGMPRAVASPW